MCIIIVEDVDFSVHFRVLYFGMYAMISWTSGYRQCLYPTYREKCQGICDCGNDRCNVYTGCRASSSLQQVSTAYYNKIVIVKHLVSIE